MTVYVDNAYIKYGRMTMCHMVADTKEELDEMADRIGVRRKWRQASRIVHYDICKSKRELAVKLGAVEITTRQLVRILPPG